MGAWVMRSCTRCGNNDSDSREAKAEGRSTHVARRWPQTPSPLPLPPAHLAPAGGWSYVLGPFQAAEMPLVGPRLLFPSSTQPHLEQMASVLRALSARYIHQKACYLGGSDIPIPLMAFGGGWMTTQERDITPNLCASVRLFQTRAFELQAEI